MRACAASACVLSLACCGAAAQPRVALYVGNGTASVSVGNYTIALQSMVASGKIASFQPMNASDVPTLNTEDFDMILFPGGSGSQQSAAIGSAGAAAVQLFVTAGGGYMGTCAGGYLAGHESCCHDAMPGYCGGNTGCAPAAWALNLVDQGVAEPWDRGYGDVTMMFSDDAFTTLQLPEKYRGVNVTVLYWQGPILSRDYPPNADVTALATFTTEIHTFHTQYTTGQMINTPALWTARYGSGRVLISPPHPEQTQPMLLDVIECYVLWTAGAI